MSVSNFGQQMREARTIKAVTATATLTASDVKFGLIKAGHASTPVALTLPAATGAMENYDVVICNNAAQNVTVVVAAGFGGGGAGMDTTTLTRGEFGRFFSDGTNWYTLAAVDAA